MKKLIYTMLIAGCTFGAPLLTSCSNEDLTDPGTQPQTEGDGVYLSFKVETMPTIAGSKASTTNQNGDSNDGELEAASNEKKLNYAKIYFTDGDYKVLTSFEVSVDNFVESGTSTQTSGENSTAKEITAQTDATMHNIVKKVRVDELHPLLGNEKVRIIIVGNEGTGNGLSGVSYNATETGNIMGEEKFSATGFGTAPLLDFGNDNNGQILPLVSYTYEEVTINLNGLSSSSTDAEKNRAIRALFTADYNDNGTKKGIKYEIGSSSSRIVLERAVARVDFKDRDARTGETKVLALSNDKQAYMYQIGKSDVLIKMYQLQIFNVNKSSYLFRHTIEGTKGENGAAGNGQYILFGDENGFAASEPTKYNWVYGSDWTSSSAKTLDALNKMSTSNAMSITEESTTDKGSILISTLNSRNDNGGYKPWRYITENTIPSTNMMDNDGLRANATGIAFKLQVMNKNGEALAKDGTDHSEDVTVDQSTGKIRITMPDTGKYQDVEWDATNNGYFLTYYGFIKHNNVGDNLDAMKYGIVRNNAYQCRVTSISGLPSPNDAEELYLQLDVKVKNWQKRVNDFQFN